MPSLPCEQHVICKRQRWDPELEETGLLLSGPDAGLELRVRGEGWQRQRCRLWLWRKDTWAAPCGKSACHLGLFGAHLLISLHLVEEVKKKEANIHLASKIRDYFTREMDIC